MLVFCIFYGCYAAKVEGVVVEAPFKPSEMLHVTLGLYGRWEVKSPPDVSDQVLVWVTLLAPLEVV